MEETLEETPLPQIRKDFAQSPPAAAPELDGVVVVLATYNERSNIRRLIPELLALPMDARVVVVDDNSPDGTSAAVEEMMDRFRGRVELIRRAGKLGYGSAFVEGFNRALEIGGKRIVSMDADYSHDPQAIPMMIGRLDEEDLVIGSRYIGGLRILNWSFHRLLLSSFANFYVKTVLGFRLFDCTSGFRAYRAETLRTIDFSRMHAQGYSFLVEILENLHRRHLKIGEAPIVYYERREGRSKMSKKVILEAIYRPFLLRWGRLFSR